MKVHDTSLIDGAVEFVEIVSEMYSMILNHIGSSTHRCGGIVSMFGHPISGSCYDEARGGRNIECILTVASRSYYVYISVAVEDGRNSCRQDSVTKAQQLVHGHTTHLQACKQGCDLFFGELTLCDANDDVLGFLTGKFLMIQHSVQNVLHFHKFCLLYFLLLSSFKPSFYL